MKQTTQLTPAKLQLLMGRIPFFSRFSDSERQQFAAFVHLYVAEPDDVIIEKNTNERGFYLLLSGTADVSMERDSEAIAEVTPGDFFGEIGFVLGAPRTSWVIAKQLCILMQINQDVLNRLNQGIREKVKDQIIIKLARTVGRQSDKDFDDKIAE